MKSNTAYNRDQNINGTPDPVNAVWVLALALYSLAKLWLVSGVELGKDEAVYWYWSQHLDASYALLPFSLMALAHELQPFCEWFLRLPSVLLGAFSTWLLYRLCLGADLTRPRALWAATAFAVSHWTWHTSSYLHPDGFLVTCWLLALCLAQRAISRDQMRDYMLMGFACGLAVLCKYSGAFLTAGLGVWLLLTRPPQRRWQALATFALPALLVATPLIHAQLSTAFYLPQTLSTLSKIAATTHPLSQLLFFLLNPLLFVSPFLLLLLYRAFCYGVRQEFDHKTLLALLPALCSIGIFLFFALYRGQIKGNWILVGFLSLWPLAFALPVRRWLLVATVGTGLLQTLAIGIGLKYPGTFSELATKSGLDASYIGLVSKRDRSREPSYSWSERLCEYSGWQQFSEDFEDLLIKEGINRGLPLVSTQYSIPFTVSYYAETARAYYTIDDPRFRDLMGFPSAKKQQIPAVLFAARKNSPLPKSLRDEYGQSRLLGDVLRQTSGCADVMYQISLLHAIP